MFFISILTTISLSPFLLWLVQFPFAVWEVTTTYFKVLAVLSENAWWLSYSISGPFQVFFMLWPFMTEAEIEAQGGHITLCETKAWISSDAAEGERSQGRAVGVSISPHLSWKSNVSTLPSLLICVHSLWLIRLMHFNECTCWERPNAAERYVVHWRAKAGMHCP